MNVKTQYQDSTNPQLSKIHIQTREQPLNQKREKISEVLFTLKNVLNSQSLLIWKESLLITLQKFLGSLHFTILRNKLLFLRTLQKYLSSHILIYNKLIFNLQTILSSFHYGYEKELLFTLHKLSLSITL